jgi:hypothetical protein
MEYSAVIKTTLYIPQKIIDGLGGLIGVKIDDEVTKVGLKFHFRSCVRKA